MDDLIPILLYGIGQKRFKSLLCKYIKRTYCSIFLQLKKTGFNQDLNKKTQHAESISSSTQQQPKLHQMLAREEKKMSTDNAKGIKNNRVFLVYWF